MPDNPEKSAEVPDQTLSVSPCRRAAQGGKWRASKHTRVIVFAGDGALSQVFLNLKPIDICVGQQPTAGTNLPPPPKGPCRLKYRWASSLARRFFVAPIYAQIALKLGRPPWHDAVISITTVRTPCPDICW
jgi:hypothetical protein